MFRRSRKLTSTQTRETRASRGANGHHGPNGPVVQGAAGEGFLDSRGAAEENRAKVDRGTRNIKSVILSPAKIRAISGQSNAPRSTMCHTADNC